MVRKSVSIDTIAKLSGYSRATVSRVIGNYGYVSEKARKRINETIEEYNYHPSGVARSMVSGKTQTIGLIQTDIRNRFYSIIAKSIEDVIGGKGYSLIICNSDESLDRERRSFKLLLEKQIDGLIISPTFSMDGNHSTVLSKIKTYGIPAVCIDRPISQDLQIPSVTVDNYMGGYEAAKHLISLGHRRIAVVTSKLPLPNVRDRERGFYSAMAEAHIERVPGDRVELESTEAATDIGAGPPLFENMDTFTALFCTANIFSIYALRMLKKSGFVIPEDISFVGFDEISCSELMASPPTLIVQPIAEIGSKAAELVLSMVEKGKRNQNRDVILPVTMIVRSSTREV
jgi:DNA-binding LacI/PurR family transcriptional regulator